jgi:hypothetical protein
MSYFAQIKNGVVQQVIAAEQEFINVLSDASDWIQTSYNTHGGVHYAPNTYPLSADGGEALNYNYAGIGYNWDGIGFYGPQPYTSWILDTSTYLWVAPVPYPSDNKRYIWNELEVKWDLLEQ